MSENGQQRFYPLRDDLQQITEQDPQQPSGVWATLGMLAGRLKSITGRSVWTDNPPTNLTEAKTHHDSKQNPHNVTRAQLGAAAATDLDSHKADQQNPHGVTAAQAGARPASYVPSWGEITSKPATYPSTWNTVADKPAAYPPATHTHDYAPASHVGSGGAAHANAVAGGAAGFMSGAEKQKLSSIPGLDATFRCEVTRINNQSCLNNESTTVIWETPTVNPRNWWSSAQPSRITPGAAGAYLVLFYTPWQASTAGLRLQNVAVNGSNLAMRNYADPRVNANAAFTSSFLANLTATTDYIELSCRQDSGGALNLQPGVTAIVVRVL